MENSHKNSTSHLLYIGIKNMKSGREAMRKELENSIKKIIRNIVFDASNIEISIDDINDNTNLIEDLGFHSIASIRLFTEIENSFGIVLDEEDLNRELLKRYKNLIDCIEVYAIHNN